jgi:hypothetical protein
MRRSGRSKSAQQRTRGADSQALPLRSTRTRPSRRTLSRSYQNDEETGLDGGDKEKLQMLETYMQSLEQGGEAMPPSDEAPLPSRAEDVDKFMAELAAAASGSTPGERGASGGDGVELQRAEEGD